MAVGIDAAKFAGLHQNAIVGDADTIVARRIDTALRSKLVAGDCIRPASELNRRRQIGLGKSRLTCALGHKACRDDRSMLYLRVPRLSDALALARGDCRRARLLRSLARGELLILKD